MAVLHNGIALGKGKSCPQQEKTGDKNIFQLNDFVFFGNFQHTLNGFQ